MNEELVALFDGRQVGRIRYAGDRLRFVYDDAWREDRFSFPLSLSMPLTLREHNDGVVRSFLSGLLPDNDETLRRWGRRFQVSSRNPFRLLSHVGEECAGAVQFVRPDRAEHWLQGEASNGVDWLSEEELIERISDLKADRSQARRAGDEGQFSLAGAQAKTGLHLDPKSRRWGIPKGITPTTHILKPNIGDYEDYHLNENFCLKLANKVGLLTATSWTEQIGGIPVIIVERFDRVRTGDRVLRVHQEDICQALGRMPESKYQNQGGPSALEVFDLIRNHSTRIQEDVERFLNALIFNWLIGGTDAHAKNFGVLLSGRGQVRLSPLYDLSSSLPYPKDIPPRKAKLAMKIGGEYLLWKIDLRRWEKAASEWNLDRDRVFACVVGMAKNIQETAQTLAESIKNATIDNRELLPRLTTKIAERTDKCIREFNG